MANPMGTSQAIHRWYTRPVLFVSDINRAANFYINKLGFQKRWHESNGAGTVCQVSRVDCEVILCEQPGRGNGRLFIELIPDALTELRRDLATQAVPSRESWWGSDVLVITDPDGNELFFPH